MNDLVQPRLASREAASAKKRERIGTLNLVAANVNWRIRSAVAISAVSQRRLRRRGSSQAFTLIELLAVIAIIAILAALIIPVTKALKRRQTISVAQAELKQMETAIEYYKSKTGFYPPDNPGNPVVNQLYFELAGTILTNGTGNGRGTYTTLDGSGTILVGDLASAYGLGQGPNPKVAGFANSGTSLKGTDDKPGPVSCIRDLKPNQVGSITMPHSQRQFNVLACSQSWPLNPDLAPVKNADPVGLNPWRYVSSNPTNNPGSYDLWVEVLIGAVTNRISNWSKQPELL